MWLKATAGRPALVHGSEMLLGISEGRKREMVCETGFIPFSLMLKLSSRESIACFQSISFHLVNILWKCLHRHTQSWCSCLTESSLLPLQKNHSDNEKLNIGLSSFRVSGVSLPPHYMTVVCSASFMRRWARGIKT